MLMELVFEVRFSELISAEAVVVHLTEQSLKVAGMYIYLLLASFSRSVL